MAALCKSPGGWFFASKTILYIQTDILVGLLYLSALIAQRILARQDIQKFSSYILKLISGPQGILAVNAVMTLLAAVISSFFAVPILAASGFLFGGANLTQAIIYQTTPAPEHARRRLIILALCEIAIAGGLAFIAMNAGYSFAVSFGLVVPVVIAGMVRSFRPHWLPPSLAYLDMMALTILTGHQAFLTGNMANAISRILVLVGLSRLAVLRATNEGKISVFAIERLFKKACSKD
jgi:hypothetical protein